MRRRQWQVSLAGLALAIIVVWFASHPLWYLPDAGIRRWLLHKVPVGSTLEDLKTAAHNQGWRINGVWNGDQPHADWGGISGSTVAWAYIGGYRVVFYVDFDSFWAFDEQGRLKDVKVRRMIDSL